MIVRSGTVSALVALAAALCLSGCGMVNPALGYVMGGLEASADDPQACCDVYQDCLLYTSDAADD